MCLIFTTTKPSNVHSGIFKFSIFLYVSGMRHLPFWFCYACQAYVQYYPAPLGGTGYQRFVYTGVTGLSIKTWWDRWKSPQATTNLQKPNHHHGGLREEDQPVPAWVAGPARSLSNTELFGHDTRLQLPFSCLLAKRSGGQNRKKVVCPGCSELGSGKAETQHSGWDLGYGSGWVTVKPWGIDESISRRRFMPRCRWLTSAKWWVWESMGPGPIGNWS